MPKEEPRIKIKKYLNEKNLTQRAFSSICKIDPMSVCNYLQGTNIHPKIAMKIEKYTRGEISYEDLTDTPRGKKYQKKSSLRWDD